MDKERVFYPDFLRVIATFAVILIHISGGAQWQWANNTFEWQVFNAYNGMSRWSVPVFFMVSGMFMLDAGRHGGSAADNFWRLARTNIPRMLFVLIAWSLFYGVFGHRVSGWPAVAWYGFLFKPVGYHLWFLYFIILLYVITPFLQVLLQHLDKRDFTLLIGVLLVFDCGFKLASVLTSFFAGKGLAFFIPEMSGYLICFLGGAYLARYDVLQGERGRLLAGVLVLIVLSIAGNSWLAQYRERGKEMLYDYLLLNIELIAFGIFLLAKNTLHSGMARWPRVERAIRQLARLSLGIYLVHIAVLDTLVNKLHLGATVLNPIIMVPLLAVLIFVLSAAITFVLQKIPVVRRLV